jgi:hypothetical protein
MTNFDHVESELIRDLCNGDIEPHSGLLAFAIGYIAKLAELDADDSDIPYAITDKRMADAERATDAFDSGNYGDCLTAIREFWSN